jgi:hypothetical protein
MRTRRERRILLVVGTQARRATMQFKDIIENQRSKLVAGTCVLAGVGLSVVAGAELFDGDGATVRSQRPKRAASVVVARGDDHPAIARHVANAGGWGQERFAPTANTPSIADVGTSSASSEPVPSVIDPIDGVMPTLSSATVARKAAAASTCQRGVEQSGDSVVVTSCGPTVEVDSTVATAQSEVDRARQSRRVTVTPPEYHRGTLPTITPPSVSGTPPRVAYDGESVTVTITSDGEVTPPGYTPGQPGTLVPPGVIID